MPEFSVFLEPQQRLPILVRFLERRVNQSLRWVPGTLDERFSRVKAQLLRRGRAHDIEIISTILRKSRTFRLGGQGLRYLIALNKDTLRGMSKNALKQTIRRLERVAHELYPSDYDLMEHPSRRKRIVLEGLRLTDRQSRS